MLKSKGQIDVVNIMKSIRIRERPSPFARFLKRSRICAQYKIPGTLHQNSVVERRPCTLMEMV